MPIDKLEIDKSFIVHIDTNETEIEIVTATIAAHTLNLVVIAEGVETNSQLGLLEPEECDVVEGFLFSKPIEASEIFRLPVSQAQP